MKVSSGKLKGMKIHVLEGDRVRPTKSGVREAVFNILGQELSGMSFCDLCAGSGSMGIEAASYGANPVVFVESDRDVRKVLDLNLMEMKKRLLEQAPSTKVVGECFRSVLKRGYRFDLVYFDPPWDFFDSESLCAYLWEDILTDQGIFFIEHEKHHISKLPENMGSLNLSDRRKYGKSCLSIYKRASR